MNNFYCKRWCGDPEFSIDEWNKTFVNLCAAGIENTKKGRAALGETHCEEQCFDCMAIVGERRKKTMNLISQKSRENKKQKKNKLRKT